jgi:nitrogenase molybdenum-iron protein alpha/beta subunit
MKNGEMTVNFSLSPHRPDSLAGAITAFEGIKNATALLNGPNGCKTYLSYLTQIQDSQANPVGAENYLSDVHFGQPRVPGTFLDEYDYVNSAEEKITSALSHISKFNYNLVGIINSPGASLIGDDLIAIVKRYSPKYKTVTIESTAFTGTFADGFKRASNEILKAVIDSDSQKIPKSVNLIGANIFQYNWERRIVADIKRTLELMDKKSYLQNMCWRKLLKIFKMANRAELNVVLYEEYGNSTAKQLERDYGIPYLGIKETSPYGLVSAENWFGKIADYFNLPKQAIKEESKKVKMKCYQTLDRISFLLNGLRGTTFAFFGDSSTALPLITYLHKYLGLYPDIIGLREVGVEIRNFLTNIFLRIL